MSCTTESGQNHNANIVFPKDTLHLAQVTSQIKGMYPVVITSDIEATKSFYTQWFNYSVLFESSWFILMGTPGENPSMIAFMNEVHPSTPPSPKAIKGEGMFVTIDVADASLTYKSLQQANASFSYPLTDEPWGQRRFALTDPNGIWIDVVEQIQPKEGWWDEYMVK